MEITPTRRPPAAVGRQAPRLQSVSVRAGIVVTGTEVLTGRVSDRNGPWLSDRLLELGADTAAIVVVGDRPEEILRALRFLAGEGCALIVTSGGLGPTADDLTAEVVGRFQGREMVLDEPLEGRIAEILQPLMARWPDLDPEAVLGSNRKQAVIPAGADDPRAGRDGAGARRDARRRRRRADGRRAARPAARAAADVGRSRSRRRAVRAALRGAVEYRRAMLRLFGMPESEIAATLRAPPRAGSSSSGSRSRRACAAARSRSSRATSRRTPRSTSSSRRSCASATPTRCSPTTARRSTSRSSSCCATRARRSRSRSRARAGCSRARLTELPGSSAVMRGGLVVYSNEAKVALAGVDARLIAALRRGLGGGRGGARRRRARGARTPTSGWG